MEDRKEKNAPWLSVPQFGDWDQKGGFPDYSLDFSKIRKMRKQNKRDASRASLGNEDELINPMATSANAGRDHQRHQSSPSRRHHHHSPSTRKSFFKFNYFNCFVKA